MQPAQSRIQPAACGPRAAQVTAACTVCHPIHCDFPGGLPLSLPLQQCTAAVICLLVCNRFTNTIADLPAQLVVVVQMPDGVSSQLCTTASPMRLQLSIQPKLEAATPPVPICHAAELYSAINFQISNSGSSPIGVPFSVVVTATQYVSVPQTWNWVLTSFASGVATGSAGDFYSTVQANGGNSVNFGYIAASTGADFTPQSVSIAGLSCQIVAA